ncbi:hypothetical protein MFUR16E_12545 [Methylobacterium fujisawaense]|uniref:sensor histidine kinase n=1 Tax=Methylobacterium fujisawaense TaxID=107400 RepID=UPI002F2D561C
MPFRIAERRQDVFVQLIQRLRPIRGLPLWARYLSTAIIVLAFFGARFLQTEVQGSPFLLFLPSIVLSSFLFDRGSGFFATLFSTALAIYFFIEPRSSFMLQDIGSVLAEAVFFAVGLFTAAVIEALRTTVDALVASEESLGSSLSLLQGVIEGTPDPIFIKDREGRYVQANAVTARILGLPQERLRGRRDRDLMPEAVAAPIEAVDRAVMETRIPSVVEEMVIVAGQGPRCFLSTKAPWYGARGEVAGVIGIARDIHERKQADAELRAANAQKEVLLHDINHRVKNHLQSVISLLAMSKRRVKDEVAGAEIENAASRLSVLARVYDRLNVRDGERMATVSAREFLQGLCDEVGPVQIGLRPIALRTQIEDVALEAGTAVSLGLALNELLQNSLKYAFIDDTPGVVSVNFAKGENGEVWILEVADDGVGIPRACRHLR